MIVLRKTVEDERTILERSIYGRLQPWLVGKTVSSGTKDMKKGTVITDVGLDGLPRIQWWDLAVDDDETMGKIEALR